MTDSLPRVTAVFIESPAARIEPPSDALQRKRLAVWANDRRNDHVAHVTTGLAAHDQQKVRRLGLLLEELSLPAAAPDWTVILVESITHGRELLRRLPDWEFAHRSHTVPHGAPRPSQLGEPRRTIMTLLAADEAETFSPAMLINAMGGSWIFQLPGYDLPDDGRRLLIVDFADDFDDQAAADTYARMRAYEARALPIIAPPGWRAGPT